MFKNKTVVTILILALGGLLVTFYGITAPAQAAITSTDDSGPLTQNPALASTSASITDSWATERADFDKSFSGDGSLRCDEG